MNLSIVIDEHIKLLNIILPTTRILFKFDEYSYKEFEDDIVKQFNYYKTTSYKYLINIYPVHFMHISFYDIYLKYGFASHGIIELQYFFKMYQSNPDTKYSQMVSIIYSKLNSYNPIDNLSSMFNQISINYNPIDDLSLMLNQISIS